MSIFQDEKVTLCFLFRPKDRVKVRVFATDQLMVPSQQIIQVTLKVSFCIRSKT